MGRAIILIVIALAVTGCASSNATKPTGGPAGPTATAAKAAATPTATLAPVVAVSSSYRSFVGSLCGAFRRRDAGAVSSMLMRYEYNSGLRYGNFGDGEGQTGDPSLLNTWLANSNVRCRYFTPDVVGHGTLLTQGWDQTGGWGLIEMDVINGDWKINDFTFGSYSTLWWAMHSAHPILTYHV